MNTYEVRYKCMNCGEVYKKTLSKQTTALGRAGSCPNCGCTENSVGNSGQKIGVFPIVTDQDLKDQDSGKYEILLETDNMTIKKRKEKE